jgi:CRP-like cAMP-binding protein
MSQELELLKKNSIFSSLEPADLKYLGSLMTPLDVHEGEILANKGEEAARFFVLASGTLLIAMDGGKALVMEHPGDFIGMELLSSKGKYTSTVTALEHGLVFAIQRTDFIALIQEDSPMAEQIMQQWRSFLEETAPFVEQAEATGFEYHY